MAVRNVPGDVFQVPLTPGMHGYAQWLADGTARFFLRSTGSALSVEEAISLPLAFRVAVFKDTPGRYGWSKIGKASISSDCLAPQRFAKRDPLSGALSIFVDGNEQPATPAEIEGLETAAVWAHPHLIERLNSQLVGTESQFLRSLRIAI
ncbi:MAG: hypothetical protein V4787_03605 [Pseudomonadota bacterium]